MTSLFDKFKTAFVKDISSVETIAAEFSPSNVELAVKNEISKIESSIQLKVANIAKHNNTIKLFQNIVVSAEKELADLQDLKTRLEVALAPAPVAPTTV